MIFFTCVNLPLRGRCSLRMRPSSCFVVRRLCRLGTVTGKRNPIAHLFRCLQLFVGCKFYLLSGLVPILTRPFAQDCQVYRPVGLPQPRLQMRGRLLQDPGWPYTHLPAILRPSCWYDCSSCGGGRQRINSDVASSLGMRRLFPGDAHEIWPHLTLRLNMHLTRLAVGTGAPE